ncbi:MAG: DUF4124 domain-containing protein [Cycloclasticus sp.]|nr:DUF4124 domain-containing protein [Cycloclasticus sp.]
MFRPLIICFAFLFTSNSHAAIYQWTDEQGSVAYGEKPPQDKTIKTQKILLKSPEISEVKQTRSIQDAANDIAKANAEREAAIDTANQSAEDEKFMQEECARANKALSSLDLGGNRLYKDSAGNYARLSDDDKSLQRQNLNAFIDENCR